MKRTEVVISESGIVNWAGKFTSGLLYYLINRIGEKRRKEFKQEFDK